MNVLMLSGSELARLIRELEISAREVVEAHIKHALQINPRINAIVKDRFAAARQEADAVDMRVRQEDASQLPPFLGVPGTIKECIALKGMPQSSGLVSRKNFIANENATAVSRYLNAGIIPIGVSNTPELCMWSETYNKLYGRTNNPYNVNHIAGGSSGGEGAIIGAGASPLGLGSDVAGSLRFPAFFNGIFSHKPTHGLVPNTGHYPAFTNDILRFNCIGPMTRRAEDLYPLLKVLAGPDNQDMHCSEQLLQDPANVDVRQLNIFSIENNGIKAVSNDLIAIQRRALAHLQSTGANGKTIQLEKLRHSYDIIIHSYMKSGGFSLEDTLCGGKYFNLIAEFFKWMTRTSNHIFPLIGLVAQERYYRRKVNDNYVNLGRELLDELQGILGNNGVLLFPTYTMAAPRHNKMLFLINHWTYSTIFNILHMPVTQVPLGLNDDGLPLGLQVVAMPGNDHLTIATALELEKAFGGWNPSLI